MFSEVPKRLPKDIDRLRFYDGTIVRKKGVKLLSVNGFKAPPPPLPPKVPPLPEAWTRPQSPSMVAACARRAPIAMQRSASMPTASRGRGPPPPLPSFPASWKPDATLSLRPVSPNCTPAAESPALRPRPKPLRERVPTALEADLGERSSAGSTGDRVLFLSSCSGVALGARQTEQPQGGLRRSLSMPLSTGPGISPSRPGALLACICGDGDSNDCQDDTSTTCSSPDHRHADPSHRSIDADGRWPEQLRQSLGAFEC